MVLDWDHLGSLQVDALREIGSIGAGNAATALAQLLNQKVAMTVPQAGILSLEALIRGLGHEEEPVACVSTLVGGEASAMVLFIWRAPDAFTLVDLLLGRPAGSSSLGEMEKSVLVEVGNILTGSFLTAFSQVTRLDLRPTVPSLAFDMLGAVLSAALLEGGYYEEKVLVIETTFCGTGGSVAGHFLLAPRSGSLAIILKAIGLA